MYFRCEILGTCAPTAATRPTAAFFFVDRTDLLNEFYQRIGKNVEKVLTMSISAKAPDGNVSYFSDTKRGNPAKWWSTPGMTPPRLAGCDAILPSSFASLFRALLRTTCLS